LPWLGPVKSHVFAQRQGNRHLRNLVMRSTQLDIKKVPHRCCHYWIVRSLFCYCRDYIQGLPLWYSTVVTVYLKHTLQSRWRPVRAVWYICRCPYELCTIVVLSFIWLGCKRKFFVAVAVTRLWTQISSGYCECYKK